MAAIRASLIGAAEAVANPRAELLRNARGIALSRAIAIACSVIAVPVIVGHLGVAVFGLWESLVALVSASTLVTVPAGGTLLWRMSVAWGRGDLKEMRRLTRLGLAGAAILGTGLTLLAAAVGGAVASAFVSGDAAARVPGTIVFLAALVLLSATNDTLGARHASMQRARVTARAQTVGQISMQLVTIGGVSLGYGWSALLAGAAAGQLGTLTLLVFGPAPRAAVAPPASPSRAGGEMSIPRYFGLLGIGALSAFLRGQTDRLVLAALASPVWVGFYAIAARWAQLLMELSNTLYVPTIAAAGALSGARRWGAVRLLFQDSMLAIRSIAALAGIALLGAPVSLIYLWMGRLLPEAALLLQVVAGGILVAVVVTGPGTAIGKGIGRPEIETRYVVVGLTLNVVLTVGLVWAVGAWGTVIASSLSWILSSGYFAWILHRSLSLPRSATRLSLCALASVAVAAAGMLLVAGWLPAPSSRLQAAAGLGLAMAVGAALLWAAGALLGAPTLRQLSTAVIGLRARRAAAGGAP